MDENKEMNTEPENSCGADGENPQTESGEAEQTEENGVAEQQEQQSYYSQPTQQSYYSQPTQQSAYGQSEQQSYGQSAYGQSEQQSYGQSAYGQSAYSQLGQQSYGQSTYSQPAQQSYGQSAYSQPSYGASPVPLDKKGRPLKNNFGMKLTFSILEFLCCCGCNIITMIMGILGCIFTVQANNAYEESRWEEFRSKSKTASIFLWIGFGFAVFYTICIIFLCTVGGLGQQFMQGFEEGYNSAYYDDYYTDDYYTDDYDTDDHFADDSAGDVQSPVPEQEPPVEVTPGTGFVDPTITLNGVTVTFPLTYAEFAAAGFSIEADDQEYVLNQDEYDDVTFYDANGAEVGEVYIGNEMEGALAMKDSMVFGVYIEGSDIVDGTTFSLPNGLTHSAMGEDFMKAYGEPDYKHDDPEYKVYQWYNHSDMYYDTDDNSITVSFYEGEFDALDMRFIGWN